MTDQATAPKMTRTRKAGTKSPAAPKKAPATGGQKQAGPTADGQAILDHIRETNAVGKQTQAKDAAKPAPKKSATKPKGGQQQAGSDQGSAGASGAGKTPDANTTAGQMRGGTKQVLMTEMKMPGRGGRPQGEEEYPFGDLPLARKDGTEIIGVSFFIPDADGPDSHLATARKRHKGVKFWSRATMESVDGVMTKGLRIWRAPKDA